MRWYTRKVFVAGALVITLWVLVLLYSPRVEVPRAVPKPNPMDLLEKRLDNIEKDMRSQYKDIGMLMSAVKKFVKTDTSAKENEILEGQGIVAPPSLTALPVLVIACNRVTVKRCLENLVKFRPNKDRFPIIVSQDCGHEETTKVIKSIVDTDPSITLVQQPDLSDIVLPRSKVKYKGYYKIARHFKFALNHVFKTLGHEAVIIVEDDLDISPDFFEYFQGTYPLLLQDKSLWCISAWNDNGKKTSIDLSHPELLHRTDFFPGLGWLLRKDSWLELEPKWPTAFWDDWLRDPENTRGRACIRPEVSRTYTFGKIGVSRGLFFDNHLKHMQLNQKFVEFTKLNLTYLLKDNYESALQKALEGAETMSADELMLLPEGSGQAVKVLYMDAKSFQKVARRLGLMFDFRSGIPRTAYRGVVSCYVNGRRVLVAPGFHWERYDPGWG
ncbi:hypothetical protein O0L34_g18540 [Tuta absoluta]|nr:hypothetical protein O0L34_g18540 [Tuta absoluta]